MTTRLSANGSITSGGPGIRSQDNPPTWEMVLLRQQLVVRRTDLSASSWHVPALPTDTCTMLASGDLVLTAKGWDSGTGNFTGAYLEVTTAGHAIIYNSGGTPIWDNGNKLYSGMAIVAELRSNVQVLSKSVDVVEKLVQDVHSAKHASAPESFSPTESSSGVSPRHQETLENEGKSLVSKKAKG